MRSNILLGQEESVTACLAIAGKAKLEDYVRNIFKNSNGAIWFKKGKPNTVKKVG